MTKSKDRVSDLVNGHASRPYNKAGMHLLLISCIIGSGDVALDGFAAPPPLKGAQPPVFGLRLDGWRRHLVRNGSRPRPRPHCIGWGPSSPRKGHSSPPLVYCDHGRPSQLLLSSCCQFCECRISLYEGAVSPFLGRIWMYKAAVVCGNSRTNYQTPTRSV